MGQAGGIAAPIGSASPQGKATAWRRVPEDWNTALITEAPGPQFGCPRISGKIVILQIWESQADVRAQELRGSCALVVNSWPHDCPW